jgi:hypothetical protein
VIFFDRSTVDKRDSIITGDTKLLPQELWRRMNARIFNIAAVAKNIRKSQ